MYWQNFRTMFYRLFGTKNVGHYRLPWGVVSSSHSHTILIRGCGCKGWLKWKWRTCQHTSHSIPHCTTNTDVNKTFRDIGSFACMNAEHEQQHREINVLAAVHWSPHTNMHNFQGDCCSTHGNVLHNSFYLCHFERGNGALARDHITLWLYEQLQPKLKILPDILFRNGP